MDNKRLPNRRIPSRVSTLALQAQCDKSRLAGRLLPLSWQSILFICIIAIALYITVSYIIAFSLNLTTYDLSNIVSSPALANDSIVANTDARGDEVADTEVEANDLTLGSSVFADADDNGIFDPTESGIPNVTINLYDVSNTLVSTTTTDIDGNYIITGLVTGNYYIIIQNPPATAPTSSSTTNSNDDQTDDDDNGEQPGGPGAPVISPIINLAPGAESTSESGPGGDQDDTNDGNGDMTIDFGFIPSALNVSVGNFIWNDTDQNGIQDSGESGIPGVTVMLYDTNRGVPILGNDGSPISGVTDTNGEYLFESLPPGNYYIVLQNIPEGYQATTQNAGSDDGVDSDLYANVPQTTPTGPLFDGDSYLDIDAGLFDEEAGQLVSIGDRVWYDHDGDGIQGTNVNEYGLSNVAVTLYDSSNNTVVDTTTTDTDGNYLFNRVPAGQYYLEFARLNEFLVPVWADTGDDTLDSDVDQSGRTENITFAEGASTVDVDAGFAAAAELEVSFWNDANQNGVKEPAENGISGAQVALVRPDRTRLTSLQTDGNGMGTFVIPPGTYQLEFIVPGGYAISPQSRSVGVDNDADPDGLTDTFTLTPGQNLSGFDAGAFLQGPSSLNEGQEPLGTDYLLYMPLVHAEVD